MSECAGFAFFSQPVDLKALALCLAPDLQTHFNQITVEWADADIPPQTQDLNKLADLISGHKAKSFCFLGTTLQHDWYLLPDYNLHLSWHETAQNDHASQHNIMLDLHQALVTRGQARYVYTSLYRADLADLHDETWDLLKRQNINQVLHDRPDYFWYLASHQNLTAPAGFQQHAVNGVTLLSNTHRPTFWSD